MTRLRDMGIQPFMITATVEGDPGPTFGAARFAQNCRESRTRSFSDQTPGADCNMTREDPGWIVTSIVEKVAIRCNNTGYKGRHWPVRVHADE